MKVLLDTNVYVGACASPDAQARFRVSFVPLVPITVLSAIVSYELRVNAFNERMRRLVDEWVRPMEGSGRVVAPTFSDWLEAADIVTRVFDRDRSWRSKLPGLLNDVVIAPSPLASPAAHEELCMRWSGFILGSVSPQRARFLSTRERKSRTTPRYRSVSSRCGV